MERYRICLSLDSTCGPLQWAVTAYTELHDEQGIIVHPSGPFDTCHEALTEALAWIREQWGVQAELAF